MQKWKEYKLDQIARLVKDTFKPNAEESLPYIGLEHIEEQQLRLNSVGHSSQVISNKFYFQPNDVLFGKLRPYFRKVVQPKFKGVCSTDIWVLRAKEDFDQDFLYYFVANKDFVDLSNNADTGTRMPRADWDFMKESEWLLPQNINEQKEIAFILRSIDNKIELLHSNNINLERLAQTFFRQWFEEEGIKSTEGTIEDEFDFTMGQSPSGDSLNETGEGIVFFQGNADFDFRFPKTRVYTTEPNRMAKKNDILVSVRAPVGDLNMALTDCCIGRGVAAFRYKHNNSYYSYTYYKINSLLAPIKQFEDNGTVFGSIGKDDFKKIENTIPPKSLIEKFQKAVNPIDEKILNNTLQINNLRKLRDTYLSKLMSGEARVKM